MAIDPVVAAAAKAEETARAAAQAAKNAADAQEIAFLDSVTNVKEIAVGRTSRDATRLKSLFVKELGYDRWAQLVADSR